LSPRIAPSTVSGSVRSIPRAASSAAICLAGPHAAASSNTQHTQIAQTLSASGDARIVYVDFDSAYWSADGKQGNNWIGRLLEVIRSELAAAETGIPLLTIHGIGSSASPGTRVPTREDGAPEAPSSP